MKIYTLFGRYGCDLSGGSAYVSLEEAQAAMRKDFRETISNYFFECGDVDCELCSAHEQAVSADFAFEDIPQDILPSHFDRVTWFIVDDFSANIQTAGEWHEWSITETELPVVLQDIKIVVDLTGGVLNNLYANVPVKPENIDVIDYDNVKGNCAESDREQLRVACDKARALTGVWGEFKDEEGQ
jgi:hypothetical protein